MTIGRLLGFVLAAAALVALDWYVRRELERRYGP